jgi:hypothetical protein
MTNTWHLYGMGLNRIERQGRVVEWALDNSFNSFIDARFD